ncbi:39S ribosomal protein L24, mitochondrial [Dispira simplex]|nr:39S ribosomal protein L24, mitochondrial [Dispira simplex]
MTASSPTGKIQKEMPIHVSNVQLIDPSTGRPTRVAYRLVENPESKEMERQRIAKGSKTVIPKIVDLDYQKDWKDGMFDTTPEAASEVTFKPNLLEPVFPESVLAELRNVHKHKYYEANRVARQAKK